MNTFTLYNEAIKINDEVENWYLTHLKLENGHAEKMKEVEQKLIECTPLSLDGKDVRLYKKIAAQVYLSATDQIKVVVSETIDSYKKDYKWLDLKPSINKDLLHIYKHVYDEEWIHQHIQKIIGKIKKQENALLDDLYRNGFAATYLMHFYNSLIEENIHYFEDNKYEYSFSKKIKKLDNPTKEEIIQTIQVCPFNYEIYKQAYIHNLYTNDLKALQSTYHVHFSTTVNFETVSDPVMQKKRDEVMEKMSKVADEIKKDDFGKELIKKYRNKSNKEIAKSYLNDCGINWEAGILTFAVFCSILNLFLMDPPEKAKHSSSEELFDMLTDILTDMIVLKLVSDISGQTTDMFEPIMNPIPNIFHRTRKSSSTTHSDSCTPLQRRRRMSFIQFILSLFIKDEWKKKYDEFNWYEEIDPYNYNSEEKYLEALQDAWKEDLDPDGEFEDYVDVTEYEDFFDYEYEIEQYQEKKEWQEKYNPKDNIDTFDINVYDFEDEDEYLDALRDAWKDELDPYDEFENYVYVIDYDDFYDYRHEIEQYQEKKEWQEKYNPKSNIYVFDVNVYDFEDEDEYLEALQDAWKEDLDPYGEFENDVDVRDYEDFDSYQEAIKKAELD